MEIWGTALLKKTVIHEETSGSPRLLGHPLHACPQPTTSPAVSSPSPICAVTTLLPSGPSRPWAMPGLSFRWLTPRAHMLAYLRINESISGNAARLATGLPGSALAGRVSHPLDDTSDFKAASTTSYPNRPALPGRIRRRTVQNPFHAPLASAFASSKMAT